VTKRRIDRKWWQFGTPKTEKGFSVWSEYGVYYTAATVDPDQFGPHIYNGIEGSACLECICGCFIALSYRGGPVDPNGACPKNLLPDK